MKPLLFSVVVFGLSSVVSWADEHVGESFAGEAKAVDTEHLLGTSMVEFEDADSLTYCFQPSGQEQQCWSNLDYRNEDGVFIFGGERTRFEMRRISDGGYDIRRFLDGKHSENMVLLPQ